MEQFNVQLVAPGVLHITDYPDAAKFVRVPDELAKPFAHLFLHYDDLMFASQCLDELAKLGRDADGPAPIVRRALWHAALVATFKCFGFSQARASLKADEIFKDEIAMQVFRALKDLRNKNVVHDENDWAQANVGAIVAQPGDDPSVLKTVCIGTRPNTSLSNAPNDLRAIVADTMRWVREKFDQEADAIVDALRSWDYDAVISLPDCQIGLPTQESLAVTRTTPGR